MDKVIANRKTVWYKSRTANVVGAIAFVAALVLMWHHNFIRTPLLLFVSYQLIRQMPEFLKK